MENYDNDERELWRAFEMFVANSQTAILNTDDTAMFSRLKNAAKKVLPYSLDEENAPRVGVPGAHNQSNALAAVAAVGVLQVPEKTARDLVAEFCGVKRRFQKIGDANGVTIYDDYAHHPTEVGSTLRAARDFLGRPIVAIFQPHRYSRTQQLGRDFGPSFEAADKVIITQLYSAFEEPIAGVSGKIVFDAACEAFPEKEIFYAENLEEAKKLALQIVKSGDVLFTMGAGDITQLAPQLLEAIGSRFSVVSGRDSCTELLSKRTTMKIGGAAKIWLEPQSEDELQSALKNIAREKMPLFVLGAGSNILAGDDGFDGAVLHLGKAFSNRRVDENKMIVGGAAMLPKLTHFALQNSLANFEWACGIPGTVGGSIWGNAGARGWNGDDFETRDCAADLESVVAFERDGKRRVLQKRDIQFAYRKSSLNDLIVTEATFILPKISEAETEKRREVVKELLARRKATQPVNAACAGCIWKNPRIASGEYSQLGAGALIEKLGLKNERVGGAKVSEIHGNFIVNEGGATFADVLQLIENIEAQVLQKTDVKLEREVKFMETGNRKQETGNGSEAVNSRFPFPVSRSSSPL